MLSSTTLLFIWYLMKSDDFVSYSVVVCDQWNVRLDSVLERVSDWKAKSICMTMVGSVNDLFIYLHIFTGCDFQCVLTMQRPCLTFRLVSQSLFLLLRTPNNGCPIFCINFFRSNQKWCLHVFGDEFKQCHTSNHRTHVGKNCWFGLMNGHFARISQHTSWKNKKYTYIKILPPLHEPRRHEQ